MFTTEETDKMDIDRNARRNAQRDVNQYMEPINIVGMAVIVLLLIVKIAVQLL